MATIQRMVDEAGAEIPEEAFEPIAAYLTSLSGRGSQRPGPQRSGEGAGALEPPAAGKRGGARPDPQLVARGQAAFQQRCTQCHDAARSTNQRKRLQAWRATVRRMAAKQGANIPSPDIEPIAAYLASLGEQGAEAATAEETPEDQAFLPFSIFATVSTLWRGGNDVLENAGFFPEVWLGADWQGGGAVTGHVQACVTCHTEGNAGNRIELAQGTLRLDVTQWLGCCPEGPRILVEGGRLLVPFGAFTAQSQPGAFRTVTKPLIYNMGQYVNRPALGPAVLPLPYSDEGFLVRAEIPLRRQRDTTFDFYVVNGLQGNVHGLDFFGSRDYVDNNFEPAIGGRWMVGRGSLRVGSSLMTGRFNDRTATGPAAAGLHYLVAGGDVSWRLEDRVRFQFEYAYRHSDRVRFTPLPAARIGEDIDGFQVETELRVWEKPRIGLLARYDEQSRESDLPPAGSPLAMGSFCVRRFTYGLTWNVTSNSLFMVNHEHWSMPAGLPNIDVVGVRWVGVF